MTTYTIKEVGEISKRVRDYFINNKSMPRYANVKQGTGQLYMRDYLYLACKATLQIPSNTTITINKTHPNPGQQRDTTTQGLIYRDEYLKIAKDIINLYETSNRPPEFALRSNGVYISFHNLCYIYSQIMGYFYESGKVADWAKLDTWSKPATIKSQRWLDLESALGKQFNNDKELAAALQKHPDYEFYMNDRKTPSQTLAALKVVGGAGANCVDVSQVVMYVLMDMGYKNVNIWRGTFNCGGHVWVTYDTDNKVFDAAGMMKYGYPIGKYMCSGQPWDLNKNPSWLLSDDAIT